MKLLGSIIGQNAIEKAKESKDYDHANDVDTIAYPTQVGSCTAQGL
jgi:hypothetical protein